MTTMHQQAYDFVRSALAHQDRAPRHVYEIGSRQINGSVRTLFPRALSYLGVDLMHGPGVDLVTNAARLVPAIVPDCVVCCEVLEHSREAAAIVRQAWKVLAKHGLLIVTCAMDPRAPHSGIHGMDPLPGEYYQNLSQASLRAMLTRGTEISWSMDPVVGDLRCWAVKP